RREVQRYLPVLGAEVDVLLLPFTGRGDEGEVLVAIDRTRRIVHAEEGDAAALAGNAERLSLGESLVDGCALLVGTDAEQPAVGKRGQCETDECGCGRQSKRDTSHVESPDRFRSSCCRPLDIRARKPLRRP